MHLIDVDLLLDLRDHRTPLSSLREKVTDFVTEWRAAKGGCDVGFRKEAVILDTAEGMILCHETGSVRGRFRGGSPDVAVKMVLEVLEWVCKQFGWEYKEQRLAMDFNVAYEIPMAGAISMLQSLASEAVYTRLGLERCPVGYRFFLKGFDDPDNDLRIRIEPAASAPNKKCFVHVKDFRATISPDNVQTAIDNAVNLVREIAEQVGASDAK